MQVEYQFYCAPNTPFYDKIEAGEEEHFNIEPPSGWEVLDVPDWRIYFPPNSELPDQGWKIHVTASITNAEDSLSVVADYCFAKGVSFKHSPSLGLLFLKNSKYGDRGSSGKFITIFPRTDNDTRAILEELEAMIGGREGPYILSDLRWKLGPLFTRYGAYKMILGPRADGTLVPSIRKPSGELVPDLREPGKYCPDWMEPPDFLEESVQQRNSGVIRDFPCRVLRALHFSNGGGVYKAESLEDGRPLILKEARPFAGLDNAGDDARIRIERERAALELLRGVEGVPELIDLKQGHEHLFLIREFTGGLPLMSLIYQKNPLIFMQSQEAQAVADYKMWALRIAENVERLISRIHSRGVVFGDLHPNNVLVDEADSVSVIDFETSSTDSENFTQQMAAPGFGCPEGISGFGVDWFAFGALCAALFVPLTQVLSWHGGADRLLEYADEVFDLPDDYLTKVRQYLAGEENAVQRQIPLANHKRAELGMSVADVVSAMEWSATPDRSDRLFPGDIGQFSDAGGGVSFVNGAAGVLWALNRLGYRNQEYVDWLVGRLDMGIEFSHSFAKGAAGLLYSLEELGGAGRHLIDVDNMVTQALGRDDVSLASGIGGVGLTLLRSSMRNDDSSLTDHILRLATALEEKISDTPAKREPTGYWHGWTGAALFFLRLYQWSGKSEYAELARQAWHKDVTNVTAIRDSAPEKAHLIPIDSSIARGTAGVAVVGRLLASAFHADQLAKRSEELAEHAVTTPIICGPSILFGLSGAGLAVVGTENEAITDKSAWFSKAIDLFRVNVDGHSAYLGEELLRLSMDYGTGTAGIALALRDKESGTRESLPFVSDSEFKRNE